jgi:fucose permease
MKYDFESQSPNNMRPQSDSSRLLMMAFAAFIVISLSPSALGVAWLHIQETFSVSLEGLGILLLAVTLGRLVVSLVSGRLIAQFGTGKLLLAGSLTLILGLGVMVISPTWGVMLIGSFVRGSGNAMIDAGLNTFVAEHYKASRMNWLHACSGIGLTIGPLMMTFVIGSLGQTWRFGYAVMIIPLFVITAGFLLTLRQWDVPLTHSEYQVKQANAASARETLQLPVVWLGMLAFFFYTGTEAGAGQLTTNLFTESRHISMDVVGYWVTFYWASFTLGRFLFGWLVDRIDGRLMLRLCLLGASIGAALICSNMGSSASFIGLGLMGFMLAPVFPTLMAQTPDRIGLRHAANAIGFQGAAAGMGVSLLLALAGGLAEHFGVEIIDLYLLVAALTTFALHEIILFRESRRLMLQMETQ